ncbi:MAG: hypothetical protein PF692_08580 [Kiritimatiellae bacterium]|jgi:hypothetical protein|nr:hypothetical protein [Kiritimatiellia bacterium]
MRILFSLLCLSFASVVLGDSSAKVTLKVLDADSLPIEDAKAMVVFHKSRGNNWDIDPASFTGNTDSNGCFTAQEKGLPFLFVNAEKDGYYKTSKKVSFKNKNKVLNRWEPWNSEVELRLKKKLNPEPMYYFRRVMPFSVPAYEKDIGFDLEEGDWVSPYGKGQRSDLILRLTRRFVSSKDYDITLAISFSNDGDGLQEYLFDEYDLSEFKWPYMAPTNGYIKEVMLEQHASEGARTTNFDTDKLNYLFRVRTVKDENGNIKSACYARMGSIGLGWTEKIRWKYWFNPNGTRNLEDDPKKNIELAK